LEPEYKIIGTRTFNLESLGSISVADVGKQMKRASLGSTITSDGIRYALGLDTPDAGYIVVGEERLLPAPRQNTSRRQSRRPGKPMIEDVQSEIQCLFADTLDRGG